MNQDHLYTVALSKENSHLIQMVGKHYGYWWSNDGKNQCNYVLQWYYSGILTFDKEKKIFYAMDKWPVNNPQPVNELVNWLEAPLDQIKIDDKVVEFKAGGIQVGCTFVSNRTIEKIAKKQKLC